MSEGGCFCGGVRIKSSGNVQARSLCHCRDCKKISGSTYSTNIFVPGDGLSITKGKPKEYTVTADSGNKLTSYFCGDCGTTLWRQGPTFGDIRVIKVGVMDDVEVLERNAPEVELYVPARPKWLSAIQGAWQKKGMPDSTDIWMVDSQGLCTDVAQVP